MAAWASGLPLDPAAMESNTWDAEADVETLEAQHHSQKADAAPEAEPAPTTEDAQEGRVGSGLAVRIDPKCIFLAVFSTLPFWDSTCPHPQTPTPAQGILISYINPSPRQ